MSKSFFQLISLGLSTLMLGSLLILYGDPHPFLKPSPSASTASPSPSLADFQNSPFNLSSLPSSPRNVVVKGGINTLEISWTAPFRLGSSPVGYLVTYTPGPGPQEVDLTVTSVHYTLSPGTYTVRIAAISRFLVGPAVTSAPVVVQAPPPPPIVQPSFHYSAPATSTYIISGITFYYQTHNLSCEETATSMALTHQGIYLSQNQILSEMGADLRPAYRSGGVLYWGDPDVSFVGNVNGLESNLTGYQANPAALMRVIARHGGRVLEWAEPGETSNSISAQEIYNQVAAGHPVIAYATWDWRWHPRHDYTAFDGRRVAYIGPYDDHVYVVVGVNSSSVLVNDPIRGQYWVSKASFAAAYSDFNMAIVFA